MKNYSLFLFVLFNLLLFSCSENQDLEPKLDENKINQINPLEIEEFSKLLFEAFAKNKQLRKIVYEESLKEFNNENDVLILSLTKFLFPDKDFFQTLSNDIQIQNKVKEFILKNKSLTIFVPSLPSGFSPSTWNPISEIPAVAYNIDNEIYYFSEDGKQKIQDDLIPGFPTVFIKANERVIVDHNSSFEGARVSDLNYSFIDSAFDPRFTSKNKLQVVNRWYFDTRLVDRGWLNVNWQRDYLYYGLNAANQTGSIDPGVRESLRTIRFNDQSGYYKISNDYSGLNGVVKDPKILDRHKTTGWSDGKFEFKVTVLTNSYEHNSESDSFDLYFTANGNELFDVTYESYKDGCGFLKRCTFYRIKTITPKTLYLGNRIGKLPNWDLKKYGDRMTIRFEEIDSNINIEKTVTTSVKIATNFSLKIPFEKFGLEFGSSAERNETIINKYTYNQINNFLGNSEVYFKDKIITSGTLLYEVYGIDLQLYEYQTGYLKFSILPMKAF